MIEVGNRGGNPQRSKWYHNYGYGNLRDYGVPDKKAAVEQLAKRYAWIDLERVGIYGHSGGGFMTAAAMFGYPGLLQGRHLRVRQPRQLDLQPLVEREARRREGSHGKDGKVTFEYDIDKNQDIAKNLKGKLLLITGDIDNNVHPSNTYRVVDALIRANKRFDFILLPGQRHGYTTDRRLRVLAAHRLLRAAPARIGADGHRHDRAAIAKCRSRDDVVCAAVRCATCDCAFEHVST